MLAELNAYIVGLVITSLSRETFTVPLRRNWSLFIGFGTVLRSTGRPITFGGPSVLLCNNIASAYSDKNPAAKANV